MAAPVTATVIAMSKDSAIPAVAKATALAARNRRRSGAASNELVIVRWRHSPLIPTTARTRMKKLLVSDANTSNRTDSSVGSVNSATSAATSTDVAIADGADRDEGPCGPQLDQLGAEQGVHRWAPGECEEGVLERAGMRTELDERDAMFGCDRADQLGGCAATSKAIVVVLDEQGVRVEELAELRCRGRADQRDGLLVGAEHGIERAHGAQPSLGDDDDVVDALGDLREQVARHEHGAPTSRLGADELADPADTGRIESVGRLVQDEHLGIAEERGGDPEALSHPHRVALDASVGCRLRSTCSSTSSTRPAG